MNHLLAVLPATLLANLVAHPLAFSFISFAQSANVDSTTKAAASRHDDPTPNAVAYLEGTIQCDAVFTRFVGVERIMTPLAESAERAESAEVRSRIFGPLAISVWDEAIASWAAAVRGPVTQEGVLPPLIRREGAACGASLDRRAADAVTTNSTEVDGEPKEHIVIAHHEAAVFAAGLHDRAMRGLALASAIVEFEADVEIVDDLDSEAAKVRWTALQDAASDWLAQHEPQESVATLVPLDAMGLVASIEYWDARHALLRALVRSTPSKSSDAALARETLRWTLTRIGANRLIALLDERVPQVGTGFLSLTACPSWPHDAWEVVESELRLRAEIERLRARLQEITERAARLLDDEYAAMLRNAMKFVESSLPIGLKVDEQLLREIEEHLSRPLDEEADVRLCDRPSSLYLVRNDGNAELTTRAWEVWGRLLTTGGLPPSEAARRQEQIDGWYDMAAQRAMAFDGEGSPARAALDEAAGTFESLMSDPWSGWAFRAMPASAYEKALGMAQGQFGLSVHGENTRELHVLLDALRFSAWRMHLELQRDGFEQGKTRFLTPFPRSRLLDAGHGMATSSAPARRRLMLDPYGMSRPTSQAK